MRFKAQFRCSMTVDQAIDILETYGSDCDPIWRGVYETTVDTLGSKLSGTLGDKRASAIRVRYSTGSRRVDGTLAEMVYNRMGLKLVRRPRPTKRIRP